MFGIRLPFLRGPKNGSPSSAEVSIVSGLPRSGTSMMMKMLEAGGLQALTDNLRTPDEDNPNGYYEEERVKQLAKDNRWVPQARGRLLKVIAMLLRHLPPTEQYRVVFMMREMDEILASQVQMLKRRNEPIDAVQKEEMARLFDVHLRDVRSWLERQSNFKTLYVGYNDALTAPELQAARINRFFSGRLDEQAMAEVVDPRLYRQRKG